MSAAEVPVTVASAELDPYINRELSQLAFNRRVLAQAQDAMAPLLERLKFLCISSMNMDEFFEIRVARLQQQVVSGSLQREPDNRMPHEVLHLIARDTRELIDNQYRVLN